MKQKLLLIVLLCLLCGTTMMAKSVKRPESYNYIRGTEAFRENNFELALEYFNKDIKENSKNGYSYYWISTIRYHQEDYARGLISADKSIKLIPWRDHEYISKAYRLRAGYHLVLADTVKALSDMDKAIDNQRTVDNYVGRAHIYYLQGKYKLADEDYKSALKLDPNNPVLLMGFWRNAMAQQHFDEAVNYCNKAIMINKDFSRVYAYRAQAYSELKKWDEATTDIVHALSIDYDEYAFNQALDLQEPALTMLLAKIKVEMAKAPAMAYWPHLAAMIYEGNKQYGKALDCYMLSNKIEPSAATYERIAACYNDMEDYKQALENVNKSLTMDADDVDAKRLKVEILLAMGETIEAYRGLEELIALSPEDASLYFTRAKMNEKEGDIDAAIDDYSVGIALSPASSFAYLYRGRCYSEQMNQAQAVTDFLKVIELENTPDKYYALPFAYKELGDNAKAISIMNGIISRDSQDCGAYYNAACLYSGMRDIGNALVYLEKALDLGYDDFKGMEEDADLDFVRDKPQFKALIEKHKPVKVVELNIVEDRMSEVVSQDERKEEVTTEVPFTRANGVCKVKCSINGLPLHFIFDTGAADVTMSQVEASFLAKNGYLSRKDVVGSARYTDANGNVSVGTVIILRKVDFGGLELKDVRASVVSNQRAPLLLGQSVLSRLGKIEIDNARQVIKVTHSE